MKKSMERATIKLVITAMMIALALIIRQFSVMFYLGGMGFMRISFVAPFSKFPAILFGPLYGAVASGAVDFFGVLLKPEGAYIPWFTITAIIGGALVGIIWRLVKNISVSRFRQIYIVSCIVFGSFGILSIGKKQAFVTYGFIGIAIVGTMFLLLSKCVKIKNISPHETFLKLIIAIGIPAVITTTLNTIILQAYFTVLAKKAFWILWIPRVAEDFIMIPCVAYVVSILLNVYRHVILKNTSLTH